MAAENFDWGPYWRRIYDAADAARRADVALTAGGAAGASGGGALIGTAIIPGLGTIIGGAIGLLFAAGGAFVAAEAQQHKNYWNVLNMTFDGGKQYAEELYCRVGAAHEHSLSVSRSDFWAAHAHSPGS